MRVLDGATVTGGRLKSVISGSTFSVAHTKNKEEWQCSLGIFHIIEW